MDGWIKIHRSIVNHWIFENESYLRCWLWMIIRANHKDSEVLIGSELCIVERGSFITSVSKIASENSMSIQSVRTFLKLLCKSQMANKQTTSKLTKVTICKYDDYQDSQQGHQQAHQQTSNKPVTTDKNDKKKYIKKIIQKKIDERRQDFKKEVESFSTDYDIKMLTDFFVYWCEPNQANSKMKFEMEKTWSLKGRLRTWAKNSYTFKTKK